jgi:hypothetical protein
LRKVISLLALAAAIASFARAAEINIGGFYGIRTINDPDIRQFYAKGATFGPYLKVEIGKGWGVGTCYEVYNTMGRLQTEGRTAQIELKGWEVFAMYSLRLSALLPYARIGYGSYSFRRTIGDIYMNGHTICPICLPGYTQSARKTSPHIAVGLTIVPVTILRLVLEAKYVPLRLNPGPKLLDLGGWRFIASLGIGFGL